MAKAFEKLKVSESRQGTIKGTPKELYPEERTLEEGRKESSPSAPQTDSPFEEPKVDIFGTGDGA